jgi:hypothetical protein
MTEHRGLGFNPADAPAHDPEPIHHGRMRVGADERIGIRQRHTGDRLREHHAGQMFDVDLMHDAGVRRNDLEVVECMLTPTKEGIPLPVARELELGIQRECILPTKVVDLHRVIDHELDRLQRVDAIRVPLQLDDRIPHGGQIDDARHAGEILQEDARRHERNLFLDVRGGVPLGERTDVIRLDEGAVLPS